MKNRKPLIILPLLAMGISALSFASNGHIKKADAAFYPTSSLPTTINLNLVDESIVRDYYSKASGYKGNNLLIKLKDILKTNQVYYPYGDVIWNMYEITDRDTNLSPWSDISGYNPSTNIITGYRYNASSSESDTVGNPYVRALYVDRNKSNPMRAHGNHQQTYGGFNREHIWPKSHGFNDESSEYANGARGDPMHLWPGDGKTNNAHSNYYYGNVDRNNYSFNSATVLDYAGANYLGKPSSISSSAKVFEPQDSDKGDIARAVFYMAARYNNLSGTDTEINAANPYLILDNTPNTNTGTASASNPFSLGMLKDMLEWNKLDPVDDFEIQRNDILYRNYTKNRNPFIDFPEWADIIWGSVTATASPSTDALHGEDDTSVKLSVSNSNLEIIGIGSSNTLTVNASDGGVYSLTITNSDSSIVSVASSSTTGSSIQVTALKEGTATLTFSAIISGEVKTITSTITVNGESHQDTVVASIINTDYVDGYASSGTSGTITKTIASSNDLTINYSGINTKSSVGATAYSYGSAFYVKNYGYSYSTTAVSGYYPSKISVMFTSSTSTAGKIGISFTSSISSSRDTTVSGAVTTSGTYEATNNDPTKLYWNISTTTANVQVSKIEVEYTKKELVSPEVELDANELEGFVGDTATINASSLNFENTVTYYFESDDTSVVAVSGSGSLATLNYVSAGTATITCTANDGVNLAEATCEVTVKEIPVTLDRIEVTWKTTTFNQGASFVKGTVYAYYSNGTSELVTSKCVFTGYDLSQEGTQTVCVSYTEDGVTRNTSYEITVIAPSLVSLQVIDPVTEYDVGDTFVKPTVKATYSNGNVVDVTSSAVFSGYDLSTSGLYIVTVSFTDKTTVSATYDIRVYKYEVDTEPYKKSLFGPLYNSKSVTTYMDTFTSTTDDFNLTISSFNNNANKWEFIRAGQKNANSTATLISESIDKTIYKVGVVVDSVDLTYVSSAKLYMKKSTSSSYTEIDDIVLGIGECSAIIPNDVASENATYMMEFELLSGSKTNGFLQISQVNFYSGSRALPEEPIGIEATTTQTDYYVGETLDASKVKVKSISPNSEKILPSTDYTIENVEHMFTYADSDNEVYTYTISALGFTTNLTVNVSRKAYELPENRVVTYEKTTFQNSTISTLSSAPSSGDVTMDGVLYECAYAYIYNSRTLSFTKVDGGYDESRYIYSKESLGSRILDISVTMSSGDVPNIYLSNDLETWVEYSSNIAEEGAYYYYKLDFKDYTYTGYVNISSIKITLAGNDTAINLANYVMFADTANQCEFKYPLALSIFESLSKEERSEFINSSNYVISNARTRFEAWARNHNQSIRYVDDTYVVQSTITVKLSSSSITSTAIVIAVSAVSLVTLSFLGKKIRRNK